MKFSDFHDAHGLSGHFRNAHGEVLHFHFDKGSDKVLLFANIAGMEYEVNLTLARRSTDHPDAAEDMVVHLAAPSLAKTTTKAPAAPPPRRDERGPSRPVLVDQNKPRPKDHASDGAPMAPGPLSPPPTRQAAPVDPQLERMRDNSGGLANRAVREAMRDDSPPVPYRDSNARMDRDMGRPGATDAYLSGTKLPEPAYARVPTIAEASKPIRPPADHGANHGDPIVASGSPDAAMPVPVGEDDLGFLPNEEPRGDGLEEEGLETVSASTDPTAIPPDPRLGRFDGSPPANPDPNWSGEVVPRGPNPRPTKGNAPKSPQAQGGVQRSPSKR